MDNTQEVNDETKNKLPNEEDEDDEDTFMNFREYTGHNLGKYILSNQSKRNFERCLKQVIGQP